MPHSRIPTLKLVVVTWLPSWFFPTLLLVPTTNNRLPTTDNRRPTQLPTAADQMDYPSTVALLEPDPDPDPGPVVDIVLLISTATATAQPPTDNRLPTTDTTAATARDYTTSEPVCPASCHDRI